MSNTDQRISELEAQIAELRQQLMRSQKLSSVGELSSSITHEFNNILTTLINYAKMGLRHKDEATRDKAFDKIMSASQRAAKITKGVLSYARNSNTRTETCSLIQIVQDVLLLIEKDLQMNRVSCQTDYYEDVYADMNANQVQQVVMNLIVNARQAMDSGGRLFVSVRASEDGKWGELSVRDTGSGIPADKMRSIFEPFFTTKTAGAIRVVARTGKISPPLKGVPKADANGQGGTGLGLSMCREIIEAHHGRIRVESTVGQGTTMTLKFPRVDGLGTAAASDHMPIAG